MKTRKGFNNPEIKNHSKREEEQNFRKNPDCQTCNFEMDSEYLLPWISRISKGAFTARKERQTMFMFATSHNIISTHFLNIVLFLSIFRHK